MSDCKFNPPRLDAWAAEVRADPAPTWLIDNLLPTDNLVLLSGHPKDSKKTWFAMWTALEAAARGHKVLIIYREGARRPTLNRFDALAANTPSIYENIYFWHRGSWWLDDGSWVKETCRFIRKEKIAYIIIDTLAKSMQSDENSSQHVGRAIQAAERLRDSGATVLLVHHLRKANNSLSHGDSGEPEPDKDLRGSSALAGAYETHWAIRSYAVDGANEKQTYLLVGGKEAEWKAYTYEWTFDAHPESHNLIAVKLDSKLLKAMPYIAGKEDKSDVWSLP